HVGAVDHEVRRHPERHAEDAPLQSVGRRGRVLAGGADGGQAEESADERDGGGAEEGGGEAVGEGERVVEFAGAEREADRGSSPPGRGPSRSGTRF
ncbi:hypothetical protein ACFWQL_40445, partial [Amycolatopsis thermoflava]|uniref:hypothetical protein n=1 Tax=Amycolatopsis thermoflava TaxID=84480 RepID=UPI00366A1837